MSGSLVGQGNIHLNKPFIPNLSRYERRRYRTELTYYPPLAEDKIQSPQIFPKLPNVKKSRKRRDRNRRAAADVESPQNETIRIDVDSDNEENTKSYRPLFWFCGILIVLIGIGALLFTIVLGPINRRTN